MAGVSRSCTSSIVVSSRRLASFSTPNQLPTMARSSTTRLTSRITVFRVA